MRAHKHYIGGIWVDATGSLDVINPSDGERLATIARGTAADVDAAVTAAHSALAGAWGEMDATGRGRLLTRLSELILRDQARLAKLESEDVGKPLSLAISDVLTCARYFEYYGGAADKVHGETIPFKNGYAAITTWEPHGVTAHIIPWNYPLQMLGRSVAPALAMGNAVVLKPAEDTSLSALGLVQLIEEAGFPEGSFNIVTGLGEEVGAALSAHSGIAHISFTGSPEVGTLIQTAAAKTAIPVTLELGGKSPHLVFADADFELAATTISRGIIQNAGQTCSAGSRVLIESKIYDRFIAELGKRFEQSVVGAASQDLDLGPVVNASQQARIESFLKVARDDSLTIVAEGQLAGNLPKAGFYVKPVLIGDVPAQHRLAQEEIFGPVLVAIRVEDEADALRVANSTNFGLVAAVWTRDLGRAMRLSKKLHAGQVYINNYGAGGGVELPFGGMKGSGHGREKGFAALYGFAALKTTVIRYDIV